MAIWVDYYVHTKPMIAIRIANISDTNRFNNDKCAQSVSPLLVLRKTTISNSDKPDTTAVSRWSGASGGASLFTRHLSTTASGMRFRRWRLTDNDLSFMKILLSSEFPSCRLRASCE